MIKRRLGRHLIACTLSVAAYLIAYYEWGWHLLLAMGFGVVVGWTTHFVIALITVCPGRQSTNCPICGEVHS